MSDLEIAVLQPNGAEWPLFGAPCGGRRDNKRPSKEKSVSSMCFVNLPVKNFAATTAR
jgi:hypothetical protein